MSIVLENAPAWRTGVVLSFSPSDRYGFLRPEVYDDDVKRDVMFHLKGLCEPNAHYLETPKYGDRLNYLCPRRRSRATRAYAWRFAHNPVELGRVAVYDDEKQFGFIYARGKDIYFDLELGRIVEYVRGEPLFTPDIAPLPPPDGAHVHYIRRYDEHQRPQAAVWGLAEAA